MISHAGLRFVPLELPPERLKRPEVLHALCTDADMIEPGLATQRLALNKVWGEQIDMPVAGRAFALGARIYTAVTFAVAANHGAQQFVLAPYDKAAYCGARQLFGYATDDVAFVGLLQRARSRMETDAPHLTTVLESTMGSLLPDDHKVYARYGAAAMRGLYIGAQRRVTQEAARWVTQLQTS